MALISLSERPRGGLYMCGVDSSFRRLVTDPEDTALESCILINDSCSTPPSLAVSLS